MTIIVAINALIKHIIRRDKSSFEADLLKQLLAFLEFGAKHKLLRSTRNQKFSHWRKLSQDRSPVVIKSKRNFAGRFVAGIWIDYRMPTLQQWMCSQVREIIDAVMGLGRR